MIPAMAQATVIALAWLLVGLLWAYRAVNRKEYSGFILASAFVLLAIFVYAQE
jgi:hypothetical protein